MQSTIVVTKASLNNGWRNVVDQEGKRYSLSKKGNVPDLFVGQTITIEYTEKVSDDGKFTNRYISAWTKPVVPQAKVYQPWVDPMNYAAPAQQASHMPLMQAKPQGMAARPLPDASQYEAKASYDPKGDSMAKMNAMNNAWAWEIAKLEYLAKSGGDIVNFNQAEQNVWDLAGKIYQTLTGKGWPEIETRKIADSEEDAF